MVNDFYVFPWVTVSETHETASMTLPDIHALVDALLGTPYATYDCWDLARHLYEQGFGAALPRDTQISAQQFQEVWYRGAATDLLTLVHPWDLIVTATAADLPVSDGVGVAVDAQRFVYASRTTTGVQLGRLRTWRPRILQLARLRVLL